MGADTEENLQDAASFFTLWSWEGDKKRIWTENVGTCGGRGGEETAKIISSQRRATPLVGKSAEVGG